MVNPTDENDLTYWPYAGWNNTAKTEEKIFSLLNDIYYQLLTHSSATSTLRNWYKRYHPLQDSQMAVKLIATTASIIPDEVFIKLDVTKKNQIKYRKVILFCNNLLLSQAENWYLPDLLTAEMNEQLDTTDHPFGDVVSELKFHRTTFTHQFLWLPSVNHLDINAKRNKYILPFWLFNHKAKLTLSNQTPFSVVYETYSRNLLAFSLPE